MSLISRCKSCFRPGGGGGGDMPWWLVPLTVLVLFGFPTFVLIVSLATDRGLSAQAFACEWDSGQGKYATEVSLSNHTDKFQVTAWSAQFRLEPKPGMRWPDASTRVRYEASSTPVSALLRPQQRDVRAEVAADIPIEDFLCTVRMRLEQHQAFTEPPDEQLMRM